LDQLSRFADSIRPKMSGPVESGLEGEGDGDPGNFAACAAVPPKVATVSWGVCRAVL
jgi:hypothetical protein